jgi:MHS family metabolite:H+ symporter-like MFS transporter
MPHNAEIAHKDNQGNTMALESDARASSGSPEVETPKITAKDLGVAAWTCSLGSALEYYDFALYSLASALIFGPMFFPTQAHHYTQRKRRE